MDVFLEELNEKRNELDGDIFEMLYTLSGAQVPQSNHQQSHIACSFYSREMSMNHQINPIMGGRGLGGGLIGFWLCEKLFSIYTVPV